MRHDEEKAIVAFIDLWAMLDDRPDVYVRAARVAGEGVRRIQGATQDLFDELGGPPGYQLQLGKTPDQAIRPAMRLGPVISQLMVWLQARHQENEVFSRIVTYVEDTLAASATGEREANPPAIAFVDLSGYTELTVVAGDERAAEYATSLQELAERSARMHRGRVVKLLGDGVMLRFPSALEAVQAVRGLISAISGAGLPPAHAGIAAGPFVVRDGDVYGQTVNLAARIAGQALAGELLVGGPVATRLEQAGIPILGVRQATLKGIAEPIPLLEIRTDPT